MKKLSLIGIFFLSCSFRDLTPKEIYQKTKDGMVMVETSKGSGTGFYITESDIITNAHVVKGADLITIKTVNGDKYFAVVSKYSDNPDLAWLGTVAWTSEGWTYAPTGKPLKIDYTYRPETGEEVFAIGNPLGLERSITQGIVSSIRRDKGVVYIQTDAAISPGSSGGPLFNKKGKVIGVATWKVPSSFGAEGLGFAISIPSINYFLEAPQDMLLIIKEKTQRHKSSSRGSSRRSSTPRR